MTTAAFGQAPVGLQARLDAFAKGKPGGIAAAWVDAAGVTFFTAGKFSATDPRVITPDTQFEIGSLTKVFTALLLAESERAGRVSRQDPAAKFLLPPGDPDRAGLASVTLLALATHTAGLPRLPSNFSWWNAFFSSDPYAKLDRAALVDSLRQDGVHAKPTGFSYSNFGIAVLGEALGAAWDTSYAEALRAHVLAPLGLAHTTLALAGRAAPADLAPPHQGDKQVPRWTFEAYAPCGALNSSARDLAIFLQAALGGEGAPLAAAFAATTKPQRAVPGGMIGLAWFHTRATKPPVIVWHNGGTAGSRSFLGFNRAQGVGLVLLTNHAEDRLDDLGFALLRGAAAPAQ
ncbi:MAG TPA: serine hydrolase domain-containing protein [Opitutaceae bacterium]|nr:serine hydrolase domain-containing protein [Opitutaceae bacterium]